MPKQQDAAAAPIIQLPPGPPRPHAILAVPPLSTFNGEAFRVWKRKMDDTFDWMELDDEAAKIKAIKLRLEGPLRESFDSFRPDQIDTPDHVFSAIQELCCQTAQAERVEVMEKIRIMAMPPGGLKQLIADVDNLKAKAARLQLNLPLEQYSHLLLRVVSGVNPSLAGFIQATQDTTNYQNIREALLRCAASIIPGLSMSPVPNSTPNSLSSAPDPLLAAMYNMSNKFDKMMSAGPRSAAGAGLKWQTGMKPCRWCGGRHLHRECQKSKNNPSRQSTSTPQQSRQQPGVGRFFNRNDKSKQKCFVCGKLGHVKKDCRVRQTMAMMRNTVPSQQTMAGNLPQPPTGYQDQFALYPPPATTPPSFL